MLNVVAKCGVTQPLLVNGVVPDAAQEVVAKMGTDWLIDSSELMFDSVKPIGAGGFAQASGVTAHASVRCDSLSRGHLCVVVRSGACLPV